nr:EOG090X07CE [Triops cancriformis]
MANHYDIPSWAGKAAPGLHLDVLKDDKLVQKIMIDQKKCHLFGRNPQMNDICIDHASCSRVHAALVWHKHLQRCFLVDLGSTHGTFIGTMRLEPNKPTQLPMDSTFHFGASTRYYTLRERPQTSNRPILEELEEEAKLHEHEGGRLGLPETETELENLTEFNTAHNRRISMLGIPETESKSRARKRKRISVSFNEEEIVINPEDIDPSVGRFRNLVHMSVITTKKGKVEPLSGVPSESHDKPVLQAIRNTSGLYEDIPESRDRAAPLLLASSLTTKLGLPLLPNPAPDIDLTPTPTYVEVPEPPKPAAISQDVSSGAEHTSTSQKKKKYAKEAWPGKKNIPNLLV